MFQRAVASFVAAFFFTILRKQINSIAFDRIDFCLLLGEEKQKTFRIATNRSCIGT